MRLGWMWLGLIAVPLTSFADSNFKLREAEPGYSIALHPSDDWKLISDDNGVKTYEERFPKQDKVAFRGEVFIQAPLQNVVTVMSDPELRKQWIDGYVESRLVEQTGKFERIEYHLTHVPWPFQNRDFVYRVVTQIRPSPPTVELLMKSVEDARIPARDGIVRGEILSCRYLVQEQKNSDGDKTLVIVEMSVDPKGAIPAWVVNLAQKRWPRNTLSAMRRIAIRPDLSIPQEIAEFFNQKPKGRI